MPEISQEEYDRLTTASKPAEANSAEAKPAEEPEPAPPTHTLLLADGTTVTGGTAGTVHTNADGTSVPVVAATPIGASS